MKIAKKAAVVLCASLMLISSGVVFQQAYEGFPATLTVNAAATEHDISQGNVIINDSGEHIITGETTTNTITIEGGTPTVTVKDVNITLSEGCPLTVHSTNFTLIIEGENTFKSGGNGAGIDVAGGNKITIKENEGVSGTLNATGAYNCSGIGGGRYGSGGTIIIEGGTVTATGGEGAAGIGGGYKGSGGEVIVKGGTVTATGGEEAAGIGGGDGGSGGTVLVNGGTITATGGTYGAGIGGGFIGQGVDFTINNGNVTAKAGDRGEDIGHGDLGSTSGTATYNGGTVNGVDYPLPPGYTVTIPATVTLGESIKIEVSDVVLGDYKSVNVDLFKASGTGNTLALSCDGKEIKYAIKKDDENGDPVNVSDTVLSATENSSVTLYFTEPTTTPKYIGNYTGTVTFKFSMEAQ